MSSITNEVNQKGPKIMHLNECFGLIFPPSLSNEADETKPGTASTIFDKQLVNDSFQQKQQQTQFQQGSLISMIHCVGSDWALKSQTNFYIPPEYYPGYTYLRSSEDQLQPQHQHGHHHLHHHHHNYAFVHASSPSNLHAHHHHPHPLMSYTMTSSNVASNSIKDDSDIIEPIDTVFAAATRNVTTTDGTSSQYLHMQKHHVLHPLPMTMPYHHPHLELPVPPLHLPWYFAALCWSFTLGGIVMLILTPSWVKYGGGYQEETKQYKRHWFPYRTFAWTLILLQVSWTQLR